MPLQAELPWEMPCTLRSAQAFFRYSPVQASFQFSGTSHIPKGIVPLENPSCLPLPGQPQSPKVYTNIFPFLKKKKRSQSLVSLRRKLYVSRKGQSLFAPHDGCWGGPGREASKDEPALGRTMQCQQRDICVNASVKLLRKSCVD